MIVNQIQTFGEEHAPSRATGRRRGKGKKGAVKAEMEINSTKSKQAGGSIELGAMRPLFPSSGSVE